MEFTEKSLAECGIRFQTKQETERFVRFISDEYLTRVGRNITKNLTKRKLAEFDQLKDPQDARKWLVENLPQYRDIILEEYSKLQEELKEYRSEINGNIFEDEENLYDDLFDMSDFV